MTRARPDRYRPVDTAFSALQWAERRRDGEERGTPARARYEEEARRLRGEFDARSAEAGSPPTRRPSPPAGQRAPSAAQASPPARPAPAHARPFPAGRRRYRSAGS
jgi:hypothetical protein